MNAALLVVLHSVAAISADSIAAAAREIAAKTLAAAGPLENVQLIFRNRSSLAALGAEGMFDVVEMELKSRGMRPAGESNATAKVTITLSENPQNFLWIAEIQRDSGRDIVMVAQPKQLNAPSTGRPPPMVLRSNLIIEQSDPVLDIAYVQNSLLVMDLRRLSLFRRQDGQWALQSAATLPDIQYLPRDPRGRLKVSGDSIQAWLPGMSCSATLGQMLAMPCAKSDAGWPLDRGPARLEAGKNSFVEAGVPPFYTVAAAEDEGNRLWIFTGVDGRATLYDDTLEPLGTVPGWGSDIAGIKSSCGTGIQIVATLPGDPSGDAGIQAFEVIRRQAVAVTEPEELPGPVTALWTMGTPDRAVAVARNSRTGRYAAYELSITCGP